MAFYDEVTDASNFVISWTGAPKNDFGVFAKGYTLAANRLAVALLKSPRFSDYEAYPVVFLYRHALELSLKHVVYRCAQLGALRYVDAINDDLHNHHRLPELMNAAAASLDLLFPGDTFLSTLVPACRETCTALAAIDPDSFSFRYPMNKKGVYATERHLVLNLSAVAKRMAQILEQLDTVRFGLNCEIDVAEDAVYAAIHDSLEPQGRT